MRAKIIILSAAFGVLATPSVAAACELDGMPGFHRYNPFAKVPGFPGLGPPAAPYQDTQAQTEDAKSDAKQDAPAGTDKDGKAGKKAKSIAPARAPMDNLDRNANDSFNPAEGLATLS